MGSSLLTTPSFSSADPALWEPNGIAHINPMKNDSLLSLVSGSISQRLEQELFFKMSIRRMTDYVEAGSLKVSSTSDISPRFLQKLISTMYKKRLVRIQRNSHHPFWFVSSRIWHAVRLQMRYSRWCVASNSFPSWDDATWLFVSFSRISTKARAEGSREWVAWTFAK